MINLTVETTSRILEKLNLCFTDGAVESMVVRKWLNTSPKDYNDYRYSAYNYTIIVDSLIELLRSKGFTDDVIEEVLPDGIEL